MSKIKINKLINYFVTFNFDAGSKAFAVQFFDEIKSNYIVEKCFASYSICLYQNKLHHYNDVKGNKI